MSQKSPKSGVIKVGVVMDPIEKIKPQKDSTLALMLGAQALGAELFYMEQNDLFLRDGKAFGTVRPVKVFDDNEHWFALNEPEMMALGDLDVILMRKDPPVDKLFTHTCHMLEQAAKDGARVYNDPAALTGFNEKIFATHFPQFCPPYVISSSIDVLREFRNEHEKIIIKPLDAMGGQGVFLVTKEDMNFEVIWEMHTGSGKYPVIAQSFIPEIINGDNRVIVFDGQPFDYMLARLPKTGSIRGNLAAGGGYEVRELTDREREIGETVGKVLKQEGIIFAGIDIIGDYLIEINITSPTCLREISKGSGTDLGKMLMEKILGA